jgi:hypothetical protein
MRMIARQLAAEESKAIADYYGASVSQLARSD